MKRLRTLEDILSYATLVEFQEGSGEVEAARTLIERVGADKANEHFEIKMQRLDSREAETVWNLKEKDIVYVFVSDLTRPATELSLSTIDPLAIRVGDKVFPIVVFCVY